MNTPPNQMREEFIAEAAVSRRSGISIVWLIPLVALAIGGWLVYKAYTEKGPTITIHFDEAAGVVAAKTVVRYRDVEIGKVGSVSLNKDLTGVTVTADLDKGTARLLGEETRFWVAQPEIGR